jgi:hypothetical protein
MSWTASAEQIDRHILSTLAAAGGRLGPVLVQRTRMEMQMHEVDADERQISERVDALVTSGALRVAAPRVVEVVDA